MSGGFEEPSALLILDLLMEVSNFREPAGICI